VRKHFFVDEAGNFDFSTKPGASRYFVLTSVTMDDCTHADALTHLRRDLVWEGMPLIDAFHATTDKQAVRDRVFALIARMDIRVDATIFEKRKAQRHLHGDLPFYKLAWFQHASKIIPQVADRNEELHVVAASIQVKREQVRFAAAIQDVVDQCGRSGGRTQVSYWPAATDPCLQIADYCCWAIQRKWERGDNRSHVLIEHLIRSEYDMWQWGRVFHY
jgi:hypothetical protein